MAHPMTERLPEIRIEKAICKEFGECWSANNPYWTGHYRTKHAAAIAAAKTKRALERKREAGDDNYRGDGQ